MLSDLVRCAWPYLPGLWPGILLPLSVGLVAWVVLAWVGDAVEQRNWRVWPVWVALGLIVLGCTVTVVRQIDATVTACPATLQPEPADSN